MNFLPLVKCRAPTVIRHRVRSNDQFRNEVYTGRKWGMITMNDQSR